LNVTHPQKLLNKNFLLLWQGQFGSNFGSQLSMIALTFWIKHTTGSATLMGTILMAASLPGVVLGPIAGTFADRYSRRSIIILTDFLSGLAMFSFAAVLWLFPDPTGAVLAYLAFVLVVSGSLNAFFNPAISAAIPDLVPPDQVARANSLSSIGMEVSILLGQGLGGLLFRVLGAPVVFLIDGVTFLFSSASECFIRIPQTLPEKGADWRQAARRFAGDARDGFFYIWQKDGLRELVFISAILTFFSTPVIFLLPFYVEDFLGLAPDWYGYLVAAYVAGTMIGYLLAGLVRLNGKTRYLWMAVFITLESAGFALLGLLRDPPLVLLLAFAGGIARGFVTVNITTLLQVTTPSEIRGRVFGFLSAITGALAPAGMGISGFVADLLSQNIPMIYIACGLISAVLALALLSNRRVRWFLSQEPVAGDAAGEAPEPAPAPTLT
jgi:MFS family permease